MAPRAVGRVVDTENRFEAVIVAHRVDFLPFCFELRVILTRLLTLNHSFCSLSSLSIILSTLIERITCHSHVNSSESRFHSLLSHIHICSKHLARFALVGSRKVVAICLHQVSENLFINLFHRGKFSGAVVIFVVKIDGEWTKHAHEVEVSISTPEIGLSQSDLEFCL